MTNWLGEHPPTTSAKKPACIVVVDDNPAALKATARLLESGGYEVHAANTGQRGLELTREHRPQLVLLDVMLPDIAGPEVLAKIKSDPDLQATSVVFLSSARIAPEHQAGGLDAGAEGYLVRPIANQELLARVRLHLRQRELTESLRQSEARFRSLVNALAEAVLVVTPTGQVRYANPAAEALFQRPWQELDATQFGIPIEAVKGHEPQVIELTQIGFAPVIAELRVSTLTWENEAARIVSLQNITEQQTARDALRDSEKRYRDMVEHLPDVVYINRNERIIYVNPAGVKLLRADSESDILGRSPFEFIHPDFHAMVREWIVRARQAPVVSPASENCLVAMDGTLIPVDVTAISYRNGEHMDIQVIARDISARRRAEAERQDLLAREQKLAEQVQQSQRLEAVGQLTGGVAHDFNNLLTVILGNAELLGEKLGHDSPLGALAGMISTAAQRGANLTEALLAFARRQALDPVSIDVNELLRGTYDLLRGTLGENIEIEFRMTPGLRPAMVDPTQLESALLNLCLNARDAMKDGGRLTIETGLCELDEAYVDSRLDLSPGQYIRVAVSDTGCGIPSEHLPHLFEPFFTTKDKDKGTGLGLAMVFGFVRQSGGQVNVYSEVGEGTTVKMYLPISEQPAVGARMEAAAVEPPRGCEKILLVEDDDMVRRYAEELLASLGYEVTSAANGPETLEILQRRDDFDLLFTDIVMPGGMNGRQLAEQATIMHPGLKILYTSGYTENAIVHHGRLDPGVNLVSKPYRRAELAWRLRAVLDEQFDDGRDS